MVVMIQLLYCIIYFSLTFFNSLHLLTGVPDFRHLKSILQVYVIACLNWISLTSGIVFGHMASVISSLQKNEEGLDLSEKQMSVIASTLSTTLAIGIAVAAVVTDKVGRRWSFIIFSASTTVNWIILYYAIEMYQFVLSRAIAGTSVGALVTLIIFVPSEYTSPNTRAFFLNMISTVAPAIGTSLGHTIGVVLHWRTVSLIGIFVASLGILFPYFWVESPHWLASKGKFEESETAFRILHGNKLNSERELQQLINIEKSKLKKGKEMNCNSTLKRLLVAFRRKYFWGLLVFGILINIYFTVGGKLLFSVLGTFIVEEITGTSDVLLFTLLIDGFIILGSCMSCILIRKTSMRTLLFSTGFIANGILVVFSICFYFKNGDTVFNWMNVALLALYFIIVNSGPYPVLEALLSELFPLELKVYVQSITGLVFTISSSLLIFKLPQIVISMGYHGLFLIHAAVMSVCLGYIWYKLPETKGKTLQEIETFFKTNNFDVEDVLSEGQTKSLI